VGQKEEAYWKKTKETLASRRATIS
jgi:hypothetical protein